VPRLIVIQGVDEGREFDLRGAQLGIGRDAANSLHLHDTEVSRRHADFRQTLDGSGYHVHDRGSANGVFVNGQPVKEALLRPGDHIQIGQTVMVYSAESRSGDITERIRMVAQPAEDVKAAIVHAVDEVTGTRILARPEDAQSPWLRTRLANLAILYEASQAVSHILDLDQLLERILELTFQSIEADRGCILLRRADDDRMEPKAFRRRVPDSDGDLTISRTITDYVLQNRSGILVSDAARDERFHGGQSILRTGTREAICVPMKGRHETLGVLYLDTVSHAQRGSAPLAPKFTEDHLSLAIALAHQAALAVEDTRNYQALVQAERLAAIGQTIAALSHHIKNILQGLRSGSEILSVGIRDKDDALLQQGWKIVDKNQGKIYDLVLDMLSLSKDREPSFEPTDLNAIVADVAELAKSRADKLGTATHVKTGKVPVISFDPEGLHRALLNLVGNALDAVADRPKPTIEIATSVESSGGWALVTVKDNGVGIASEQLDDLFKPFVSNKGSRGTGLGLAVSRKILREHGGDILVRSTPNVGSTFTLRLPIRAHVATETVSVLPTDDD
jgi:signal transduction histidine kinase